MTNFDKTIKEMLIGFKGKSDTPVKHIPEKPKHPDNFSKQASNVIGNAKKGITSKVVQPTDDIGKSGLELQQKEESPDAPVIPAIPKIPKQDPNVEVETFVIVDEGNKIRIVLMGFEFCISKLVAKALASTLNECYTEGIVVLKPLPDGTVECSFGSVKVCMEQALVQAITRFSNKSEACKVNPLTGNVL